MNDKYEVSVVVLTYNSDWIDLKRTLYSIINQKGIAVQIIVSDDGSNENYEEKIKEYFAVERFDDYKLVLNTENKGTVLNLMNALDKAEGKYVKPLSPGDFLYNDCVLKNFMNFINMTKGKMCFGDAVYYCGRDSYKVFPDLTAPRRKDLFKDNESYNFDAIIKQFALNDDGISGATIFAEKEILREIIGEISGIVKCMEDLSNTICLLKGIKIHYYPTPVIWYQYGTGISTKKNSSSRVMANDTYAFWKYVKENYRIPKYINRVVLSCYFRIKKQRVIYRGLKILICPERMLRNRKYKYTQSYEEKYLKYILQYE